MTNQIIQDAVRAAFAANPDNPALARLSAAQAVLESGLTRGTPSGLATRANNFHGIKGTGPAGSVNMFTREAGWSENANFRKFNTPEEGFKGHREFLERNQRYTQVLRARSFEDAAQSVKAAGYATDPDYVAKLTSIHDKYIQPTIDANPEIASGLMEWQKPLKSSPAHVIRELEALGTEQARKHLQELNSLSVVTKDYDLALNRAVSHVSAESKHALSKAGVETSSRNLSLAEIVGGQTAVKLLQTTDKSVTLEKLIADGTLPKSLVAEFAKNVTPETKKEAGLSQEKQDNPEKMTLDDFLSVVDATGKKQKLSAYEKARGQVKNEGNRSFLDEMLGSDLGVGGFFMLLLFTLVADAMGLDAEKLFGSFLGGRTNGRIGNGREGYSTDSGATHSTFSPERVGSYDSKNQIVNRSYTDVSNVPYLKLPEAVKPDVAGGWTAYAVSTEGGIYRGPMAKGMIVFRAPDGAEHRFGFVSGGGTGGENVRGGPAPGLNALKSDSRLGINAVYQLGKLEVGGRGAAFTGDNGQNFFVHTPSNAQSQVGRSEIGIHPDGGNYGTAGCFGLDPTKTAEFIKMWNSIPPDQRPRNMYIVDPKLLKNPEHLVSVNVTRDNNDPTKFIPVSVAPAPEKHAGITPDVQRQVVADAGIAAAAASMKSVAATPVGNDTIASAQAGLRNTGVTATPTKTPVAPPTVVAQNALDNRSAAVVRS